MWRLGLTQTATSWRRLIAATVAVTLGAMFVAATLLATSIFRQAALDAAGEQISGADYLVYSDFGTLAPEAVAGLPGVAGYHLVLQAAVALGSQDRTATVTINSLPEPPFTQPTLLTGALPTQDNEVILTSGLVNRLQASPGDTLTLYSVNYTDAGLATAPTNLTLQVTGVSDAIGPLFLTANDSGLTDASMTVAGMTSAGILALSASLPPETVNPAGVLLTASDAVALEAGLNNASWALSYQSRASISQHLLQSYTGMSNPAMTVAVLFVLIALAVAGLVVANTLHVLVAQRAALFGVLRSVGATRGQVRRTVVLEGIVVGGVGGLAGAIMGHAAVFALLAVLRDVPEMGRVTLGLNVGALVIPVLVGMVVTILASLGPARAAGAVAPLAAVRLATTPRSTVPTSARMVGMALMLMGLGAATGALLGRASMGDYLGLNTTPILVLAGLGVVAFGAGLLIVAPVVFPAVSALVGALLHRVAVRNMRPAVELARTNLRSDVRRTAATSNALLLGVSLVALLVTGAGSARASLSAVALGMAPTDVVVSASGTARAGLTEELIAEISKVPGVVAVAPLYSSWVILSVDGFQTSAELLAGDPGAVSAASYSAGVTEGLAAGGGVNLTKGVAPVDAGGGEPGPLVLDAQMGIADGQAVSVQLDPRANPASGGGDVPMPASELGDPESGGPASGNPASGDPDGGSDPLLGGSGPQPLKMTTFARATPSWVAMTNLESANQLGFDLTSGPSQLWIKAEPGAAEDVTRAVSALVPADGAFGLDSLFITTPGTFRAQNESAIATMVGVATGLLAISIVIALLGVTNTLSLSVFERRQEIALLRAVGLTRKQLRGSLAVEGLIITLAATVLGLVLGALLGLGGSFLLFAGSAGAVLVLPWEQYLVIALVALVAGPAASVLPALQAIRQSPVAVLSED